jgi:hypothetical protein
MAGEEAMATVQPTAEAAAATADAPTVDVQVVSPSAGMSPQPLPFPGLPHQTTIKQLRERIREAVSWRPSDEQQRLIFRGRLLGNESHTLLQVFGEEAVSP